MMSDNFYFHPQFSIFNLLKTGLLDITKIEKVKVKMNAASSL